MNVKIICLSLLSLVSVSLSAQRMDVKDKVLDCGQVLYNTPVTVDFEIKNKSLRSTQIKDIMTSCGCTMVEYPHAEISGGDVFTVKAIYDARQLGHFVKQIFVYFENVKQPIELTLKGVVVEEIVDFAGEYPFTLGQIRADRNNIEFDDITAGAQLMQKIQIFNTSDETVQPVVMHLPNYLKADISPSKIAPRHSGVVMITLDSRNLRDYGLTQTSLYLGAFPGDKIAPAKEITVSAVILPSFGDMTESQLVNASQIKMSSETLDLSFDGKKQAKGEILIENTGKSILDISSLQMFTTGMQVSLNKSKINPGEQAKLKISVTAKDIKDTRSKPRVLMITNDPKKPKVVINVNVK